MKISNCVPWIVDRGVSKLQAPSCLRSVSAQAAGLRFRVDLRLRLRLRLSLVVVAAAAAAAVIVVVVITVHRWLVSLYALEPPRGSRACRASELLQSHYVR